MPGKSSADFKGVRLAMLLLNLVPLLHLAATLGCFFLPGSWPLRVACAAAALYLLPVLPGRLLRESLRRAPSRIPPGSGDFLKWWVVFQCQVVFLRFPALEEILRCIPGLYSLWLRLWGSRIGKLTYWAPHTIILDRGFLDIGDHVVFGAGVRLNPHVMDRDGQVMLSLAPVTIGDGAMIGGYSLLTAGTVIAAGEATRAFLICPPFSTWKDGRRIRQPS
ncbi:MAG: hypothetical protein MUF86_17200 [Akkermansiaceae bacterium]|jgi:hypothetical protein|nr:hypothetical protein [Akkermansiaceae bacterium]MCU0779387.1 hypothetical protein [Akkermansiaceae bacterium]